ncbi:hypothetical protein R75465_01065 [Paraburkholderia aspalathi]|uniref:EAL domain-containing protein n=1 Tax=Paraburkholderia aspalathi TaxID=1324617 RepID=UPI001B02A512|nr:hypothetical protein R75465_01065 [Paraburkholderia aspalathi]
MNQRTLNKAVIASFIALSAVSFGHREAGGIGFPSAAAAEPVKASKLGDLSPFRKIAADTAVLVDQGNLAGGKARIKDLELAWDDAEPSLKPRAAADWHTAIAPELMAAVPRDPRACVVMSALLDLLHALDVQIVVNGVETKAQLQWLSASWPQALVQGFLFSRPKAGLANVLAPSCES